MRILFLIILLLIFGYALALVLSNSGQLAVDLLFTQVPAMNAGLLLIICIGLGMLIGLLLGIQLFRVFQINWENSRLKKEVSKLRKEQVELAAKAANQAAVMKGSAPDLISKPAKAAEPVAAQSSDPTIS